MYKHINFFLVYLLHVVSHQYVQRVKKCADSPKIGQLDSTKASPIFIKGVEAKKEKTTVPIDPRPILSARTNLAKALE